MKQIQHQLKQKQEQKASLIRQVEAANREEEQLQQIQQILSSYLAPKYEAARSSTTKQPKEDIQEISSDDSQSQTIHKTEKQPMASNQEEYPPLKADHENIKKWYVIINGENEEIYDDWGIANSYILGKNVIHKSYKTTNEAEAAYNEAYKTVIKDNVECSKTVHLTPQKPISNFTPQKLVSILKSLNRLNTKLPLKPFHQPKKKKP
ncbi:unnamed protein product [Lactuca saligna]|uniref:Ribonuclease H1 N-terminal domain-containing protein n=1 Tax=Lactuca saligna TaxID=75948 RepID=A0AA35YTH1_LACSI|nr:unnamed protein product [Lactuca saligna]